MLISLDWIRDFVNIPDQLTPKELGERLTLATAEVEEVKSVGEFYKQIRVVEIVSIEKHPEADKLNLVTFKASDSETFRVVCGASNVRVGLKTPFAPIGTTLPIGFTLEPKKIRGVLSEGMLCSEEELGLAESSKGIMELPENTPLGVTLKELWSKKEDVIFDIDNKSLTHRPDLWGHYGFAREFSAIFENELSNTFNQDWAADIEQHLTNDDAPIKVRVDNNSSCQTYLGLSLDGVTVGPSPSWIQDRLYAAGLRPINNIVDVSNYVMLELGHPLHIFDREEIKGEEVFIRQVGKKETFTTLDEEKRELAASDTVICDNEKTLVLAGVMGGLNSGVKESTTKIFVEVANWSAALVRETSSRLGLRTDSSSRFEKTLDSNQCRQTMLRTIELIMQLCPGAKPVGNIQVAGPWHKEEELVIEITSHEIIKVLGKTIDAQRIQNIFESLDFVVDSSDDVFKVTVPSFRSTKDISLKADLIEEIGRVIGYDNIEPCEPFLSVKPVRLSPSDLFKRKAQDFFSMEGKAYEVNTYAMVGEKLLQKTYWKELSSKRLKLLNALSKDSEIMRDSMIPSLLEAVSLNAKSFDSGRFFEVGRSYQSSDKTFAQERKQLGIVFYSKNENPFMNLLNTLQRGMRYLNVPFDFADKHPKFKNAVVNEEWMGVHPFEFKNIRIMGKMNGVVMSIHPLLLKKMKIRGQVAMAIVDYTDVVKREQKSKVKYEPLNIYPGSRFDFTVTMKKEDSVDQIFNTIKSLKIKELKNYGVVDIYTPKENKQEKFVTMMTYFENREKTLDSDTLKNYEQRIISKLADSGITLKGE